MRYALYYRSTQNDWLPHSQHVTMAQALQASEMGFLAYRDTMIKTVQKECQ